MPAMQVRDVMTATPMTIDPEAPVETAVAVMRERGLRHLPVVNADGRLIGIVTDRDLRSAMFGSALAEHLPPEQGGRLRALTATLNDVRVSHVMTWQVVTERVMRSATRIESGHATASCSSRLRPG